MEGLPELRSETLCVPNCNCWKHEQNIKEDRRLLVWDRNQRKSERIRNYLCESIARPKDQLLMNSLEKHRRIQEQRTVATYAQVPCQFDKYRGNPMWWKLPPKLKQICDEPQEYFIHLSRLERFVVPSLEYIRIPKLFATALTDKPLGSKSRKDDALKRLDSCCLKKIEPHVPDVESIYVIGETLNSPLIEKSKSILRKCACSPRTDVESSHSSFKTRSDKSSIKYLMINDQTILKDSQGAIKTSVIFDTACGEDTKMSKLFLQNHSTWTLRISFQEINKISNFATPSKSKNSGNSFFFDRNYHIIMPCQIIDVPFWFKNPKCGFFDQLLKMTVVPDLWFGKLSIHISLNASSLEVDNVEKCNEYEQMIQKRVRYRLIRDCLDDILQDVPPRKSTDQLIKTYTYDKGIIFEALNSTFDPIHDRPKYLYDKEIVDELEAFYQSVRLEQHPEFWSLNLNDLRTVTKDREAFERVNTLTENYNHVFEIIEQNKVTRDETRQRLDRMFLGETLTKKGGKGDKMREDKKPKKEKDASEKSSKTSSKKGKKDDTSKIKEPKREDLPKTLSNHLEEIILKLRSPVIQQNLYCQRFKMAYNLFCSYIDKISVDVQDMCKKYFSLERPDPLEIHRNSFNQSHMNCDQLLNCDINSKAFYDFPKIRGTPQPAWALAIPLDDYQARFDAMQSATQSKTNLQGKKTKGNDQKKKDGASIKSKETKRTSKSTSKLEIVLSTAAIDESENPDAENVTMEEVDTKDENWFYLIPHDKVDHYRNNIYIVFYKNLCDFVDDLEVVYGMISDDRPGPAEIQRIKFSQQRSLLLDEGLQVQCINLNQKISEMLTYGDTVEESVKYSQSSIVRKKVVEQPKQDLIGKSSSIWNVIQAYVPQKVRKIPEKEGDVFAIRPCRTGKLKDGETTMTPEEIITERNVQTSICSDITVNLSDGLLPQDVKKEVCVCGRTTDSTEVAKRVSSFHNSECCLSSTPSCSSADISSNDT